jgi:cellobiose phosphorylase
MSLGLLPCRYGYFDAHDGSYVVSDPRTPRPWVNVISNGDWSFVVSQTGSGYSWRGNAAQNRITRSNQDLIEDDWGKYLYIRDTDSGEFWSAAWMPLRQDPGAYRVRHAPGHSTFTATHNGIASELEVFAVPGAPVELQMLTLRNPGTTPRRLDVTSYFQWVLGHFPDEHREFHRLFVDSRWDQGLGCLYVEKHLWGFPDEKGRHNNVSWPYTAFPMAFPRASSFDADKESFLGMYGDESHPRAMREPDLARRAGRYGDPAASLRVPVTLGPGEERVVVFRLGAAEHGTESAEELARCYTDPEAAARALRQVEQEWSDLLYAEKVETPDQATNLMVGTWLKYQAVSGRLRALSGYYQVSGGYGFRDQLQDSLVYLPLRPELTRRQILLHAAHQFQEGDVLPWWLQIGGWGPRTRCSDDLLWLPYVTTAYLAETRDEAILDQRVPFTDGNEASRYEHCRRAIERVFHRFSPRGIPLMGDNDWNDGLSAVGTEGKAESFWVGEFLHVVLGEFVPVAESRGDAAFADRCREVRENLSVSLNRHGWDGSWCLQATTDSGQTVGPPSEWGFRYTRMFRGATYEIRVDNPAHRSGGVARLEVDGEVIEGNVIPDFGDRATHRVWVALEERLPVGQRESKERRQR